MTRRSYVSVNGEWVEKHLVEQAPRADYHIMPDIKPYTSMIDGHTVTSRSEHRTHLRDHGMIEIGNETKYFQRRPPLEPDFKSTLIKVVKQKLGRM